MGNTSETRSYNALISTTLENWSKTVEDEITTSMFLFYMLKRSGSWVGVDALGERAKFPLRYKNGNADSLSGYDIVDTSPMDGATSSFWPWRQMAASISINDLERAQNSGEYQMVDLLELKTNQALDGIKEKFSKALQQGNGINSATAITTAYTSPINGSVFIDPLPLLVGHSPTSGTIGSIAANVSDGGVSWWANQQAAATDSNFASFLKDLDHMRNLCGKGIGGFPDTHLVDVATYEFYTACLRNQNRYTDTTRADIPFDNIAFHGKPVTWDEFMPNWSGGTTVQSTTAGTWLMLNSKCFQIKYSNKMNFTVGDFIRPENQLADVALVSWTGAAGVTNRRKHGVLDDINTTLTS